MIREATAVAPGSVANLGVGFDVLGLAIEGRGDRVRVRLTPARGVECSGEVTGVRAAEGIQEVPKADDRNTALVAALAVLREVGACAHAEVDIEKGLPVGSGLGSSAASAVAGAYAANLALGSPLRKPQLLEACLQGESAASGRHADNVAPALLGGLVLVRRVDPIDVVRLPLPPGLWLTIVEPRARVLTSEARAALPTQATLASAIQQSADIASFVSACYSGDLDLMGRCMNDVLAEPTRMGLIDGAEQTLAAMRAAGALGASISGSGPALFALCRSRETAEDVASAARSACGGVCFLSRADAPGVRQA